MPDKSCSTGEHICGNLDNHRWIVLRGLKMRQETYNTINEVSKKGKGNDGTWTSIETVESHIKMRYNNSTTPTIARK